MRPSRWRRVAATCVLAGIQLGVGPARGAEQDLGTFRAWRAHAFDEGKERVCSMWSQPRKAAGDYTRRGEIFAFITHRPADDARDKVSFEMGYDFQPGHALAVKIDGVRYTLVTSGSTAWADDAGVARKMVAAMKAGLEMVVIGVSSRGTETTDTYSLSGFTAAHRAISAACK